MIEDRHLAELAVDVQSDVSHADLLSVDDARDQVANYTEGFVLSRRS